MGRRYSSKRRGYRSRVVKMKFQSFFDISTEEGEMQIISVNAGGSDVIKRLAPFFGAYKYYKLGGVSFKLIPASTLPVDPSGLSYEPGENQVNPKDQLTPGMCRITNGEDILEDISGLSAEVQRDLYNNMLLDPRWYKWMLQSGVKRFAKPRYWQVGQLHQDKWPGSMVNVPKFSTVLGSTALSGTDSIENRISTLDVHLENIVSGSSSKGIFQTGHRGYLGWMPTDGLQEMYNGSEVVELPFLSAVPEIELFKILMPPVFNTNYYYRAFVTETVYFKEPIVMNINGYRPLDVFHYSPYPVPIKPGADMSVALPDSTTGGNDGSR